MDNHEIETVRSQLSEIALFEIYTAEELDQVLPYFELETFADNTTLSAEGDRGHQICVVLEGTVDVRKESITGNQQVSAKFGRGSILGEMSIIDEYPRSANSRVSANSKLLLLSKENFERLSAELPHLAMRFLREITRILAHRLRHTSGRFGDIF